MKIRSFVFNDDLIIYQYRSTFQQIFHFFDFDRAKFIVQKLCNRDI